LFDSRKVETPFALVDRDKVQANAEKIANYCSRYGLLWRPHIKTHKSRTVAAIQLEAGAIGLTVATPREAEVMASVCNDLLIAYPVWGESKLDRIMNIPVEVDLMMAVDSRPSLNVATEAAERAGRTIRILVEVDLGMRRVGLQGIEEILDLVQLVKNNPMAEYKGIMFYPGHIRVDTDCQTEDLEELSSSLDDIMKSLEGADSFPEIVSGGSTPTLWNSHEVTGLTEIRSGTCIFYDMEDLHLGIAGSDEVAYSVVSTIVSTSVPGQAVMDAGSKALSKENRGSDGAFGVLLEHPEVRVKAVTEEHGVLDLSESEWRPEVGEMVRVIPSHVCVSANLQDCLVVVNKGEMEEWAMEARGRKVFIP